MPNFELKFDRKPFEALDQFALLACQKCNLGDKDDWFGEFRGGLFALYARMHGVEKHYSELHSWLLQVRNQTEIEYQLASIFFNLDSALECFTYALNALGWAAAAKDFRPVNEARALKRISPADIVGDPTRSPPYAALPGYATVFPALQSLWERERQLIQTVRDLHDVSKHRRTIFIGGQARLDAPHGFFERVGDIDERFKTLLLPMAEVLLQGDPKLPNAVRPKRRRDEYERLERIAPSFCQLVTESGAVALEDAQAHVPLAEPKLLR